MPSPADPRHACLVLDAPASDVRREVPGWRVTTLDDPAGALAGLAGLGPVDVVLDLTRGGALGPALGLPLGGSGARARAVCADRLLLGALARTLGLDVADEAGQGRRLLAGLVGQAAPVVRDGEDPGVRVSEALAGAVGRATTRLLAALEVRDLARAEWCADDAGRPRLLGVEASPALVLEAGFARLVGLEPPRLLAAVLEAAHARDLPRVAAPAVGAGYVPGPVVIRRAGAKGHGLFASRGIRSGEAFCEQPAVLLDERQADALDRVPALSDYEFDWDPRTAAFAMGHVAFMNHDAERPNVVVERDLARGTLRIRATRDVAPGEELCFPYRCGPWWSAPAP